MKFIRAASVVVGLADLGFAVYFLVGAKLMPGAAANPEYPRWLGMCSLGSAALLFLIASDPERYFPVLFVDAGARALAALVGIPSAITGQIAIVVSEGALAAILIAVIVHALKEGRQGAAAGAKSSDGKKPAHGKG